MRQAIRASSFPIQALNHHTAFRVAPILRIEVLLQNLLAWFCYDNAIDGIECREGTMTKPCSKQRILFATLLATSLIRVQPLGAEDKMSRIKSDERVVFFPTVAHLSDDARHWVVPIHGWIFEPEDGDVLREAALRKLISGDEPSTKLFNQRIRLFLTDNERGKRIGVRVGDQQQVLDASGPDGHFTGTIEVPVSTDQHRVTGEQIRYEAITRPNDDRRFKGIAYCLPPSGVSVISDIDDTIKITEVTDKAKLLENTFFREFRAADGMAKVYQGWADDGADFHLVSASPWQLFEPLSDFTRAAGFPDASFHLRKFRLKDINLLNLNEDPVKYKLGKIEPLLKSFPDRVFILVGDSGEKDPDVYGILARRYPKQIKGIFIRDVTGDRRDAERYDESFRDVEPELWQVFRSTDDIDWPSLDTQ